MPRRTSKATEAGPHRAYIALHKDGSRISPDEEIKRLSDGRPMGDIIKSIFVIGNNVCPEPSSDWLLRVAHALDGIRWRQSPVGWEAPALQIIKGYQLERFKELHMPDDVEVRKAIRQIEATVRKLKMFMDLPRSNPLTFQAAWARIDAVRSMNNDESITHDTLYGPISAVSARLAALRSVGAGKRSVPHSLAWLVFSLADFVEAFGGKATGSNGMGRKQGSDLSPFAFLVQAIIFSSQLLSPCKQTDTALNKAVLVILKERGENKR